MMSYYAFFKEVANEEKFVLSFLSILQNAVMEKCHPEADEYQGNWPSEIHMLHKANNRRAWSPMEQGHLSSYY